MKSEKKTKKDSRIHPENADNNSIRKNEKNTLTPLVNQSELWYNQASQLRVSRVHRTPGAFRREGQKR